MLRSRFIVLFMISEIRMTLAEGHRHSIGPYRYRCRLRLKSFWELLRAVLNRYIRSTDQSANEGISPLSFIFFPVDL